MADFVAVVCTLAIAKAFVPFADQWLPAGSSLTALLWPGSGAGGPIVAAMLVGLVFAGCYGTGDARRDLGRLFSGVALGVGLTAWQEVWQLGLWRAGVSLGAAALTFWVMLALERFGIDRLVSRLRPSPQQAERVLLVSDKPDRFMTVEQSLLARPHVKPVGRLEIKDWVLSENGRALDAFCALVDRSDVDTVVLCTPLPTEIFEAVVRASTVAGCRVLAWSRVNEAWSLRPSFVRYGGLGFVDLTAPTLKGGQLLVKRVVDVVGAVTGLILLSPFLLLIAVAIKLDTSGPVFFRQDRIGRGKRPFRVWKFRTMRDGVSHDVHKAFVESQLNGDRGSANSVPGRDGEPVFKLITDDRVTRVGRFLRRMSLDELPQLINVLRGEMSLVGPRPPLPYEVERYERWQFDRLGVLPGMTGLWQVSGRSRLTYREMCELDVSYVERWSLWLDFKILLKTVPVVLFNSGNGG